MYQLYYNNISINVRVGTLIFEILFRKFILTPPALFNPSLLPPKKILTKAKSHPNPLHPLTLRIPSLRSLKVVKRTFSLPPVPKLALTVFSLRRRSYPPSSHPTCFSQPPFRTLRSDRLMTSSQRRTPRSHSPNPHHHQVMISLILPSLA